MAMKLTVIRTENTDPYENLAAEEYLTMNAEEDEVILFLWQNAHTVVIGRNQNPWKECNVERIKQDGVCLARRMSGGGAVYHDMGNLNFTFIAKDGLFDVARQTDVILLACRLMGINASKTGRNDLTVEGRKFSGHAYFSSQGYNYHHGTIMLDVNAEDLSKYLNVPDSKLKSKGVASVRSRVTNLKDHISDARLATASTAVAFFNSKNKKMRRLL
jgi:lipoate-protein ligase A